MPEKNAITRIVDAKLCTGCGACKGALPAGKVDILLNAEGYLRPVVKQPLSDADNHLVEAVCPGTRLEHDAGLANYHTLWGPLLKVRTGYAIDPETRYVGSSGGGISALLIHLLETGQVDYVLQTAVSSADPLLNKYQISRSRADVLRAAGSRYAPSAPLEQIGELLAQPGRFAFVGKPCDVAGLRNLARQDGRVAQKVPVMIAFMCAGVPSMKGTDEILQRFNVKKENVVEFRYRGNGWPGYTTVCTKNGEQQQMDYATSWGTILNRHLQFRCKICPDGVGEFADIVCADAWYGKDGYPDFAEQEGRSLMLTRTDKGEQVLQQALQAGAIAVDALDVAEIEKMQPYQAERKRLVLSRLAAMRTLLKEIPTYKNMHLVTNSMSASIKGNIKSYGGTLKRLIK